MSNSSSSEQGPRRRTGATTETTETTMERRRRGPPWFRSAADGDITGRCLHQPRASSGSRRPRRRSSVPTTPTPIVICAVAVLVLRHFEVTRGFPLAASTVTRPTGSVVVGTGAGAAEQRRHRATSSATSDVFVADDASSPHARSGGGNATTTAKTRGTFVLPVFPLRKSVRVPTQSLTLNLYEPRYVALAERVLYDGEDDDARGGGGGGGGGSGRGEGGGRHRHRPPRRRVFGALYCSSKTQIVRDGGQGPITPLVDVGDVGAVCDILDHSDTVGGDEGKKGKISIRALAVGRFRVERILSDGYSQGVGTSTATNVDGGNDAVADGALPYILVEASRVDDVVPPAGSDEEVYLIEAEELLFQSMLDVEGEGGAAAFGGGGSDVEEDEVFLAANRLAPLRRGDDDEGGGGGGGGCSRRHDHRNSGGAIAPRLGRRCGGRRRRKRC